MYAPDRPIPADVAIVSLEPPELYPLLELPPLEGGGPLCVPPCLNSLRVEVSIS